MKIVLLIGTSHEYQLPAQSTTAEFRQFLIETCMKFGVQAVAEEMSLDGLTEGICRSICAEIAEFCVVPHRYCDLDRAQRQMLGVRQENDIRCEAFLHNWEQDQARINREIRFAHAVRESHWLGQLLGMDCWPVLFVCGVNHIKPFDALLRTSGLCARLVAHDWAPSSPSPRW